MYQNGVNGFLYASVFCVNLITINAGSALSWSYAIFPKLRSNDSNVNPLALPITPASAILLESLALIGCLQGTLAVGVWRNKLGSKKLLLSFSCFIFAGHLMCATGQSLPMFLIAKFLLGLGVGCVLTVVPSYVAEIAEDSNRGRLGCVMGMMLSLGIASNYLINNAVSMEVFCVINLIPLGIFYFTFLPYIPESPYYYVFIENVAAADKSLSKFRTKVDNGDELLAIMDHTRKTFIQNPDLKDLFKLKVFVKGLILTCGLLLFQLFPGFYYVLYESEKMPQLKDIIFIENFHMAVTGIQIFTNIFVMLLVDNIGRKPFLLTSAFGASVILMFLGFFLYCKDLGVKVDEWFSLYVAGIFLLIIFYNLGFSIVIWTVSGEIFSISSKSQGICIAICIWNIETFVFGFLFPYLGNLIGLAQLFCGYGIIMVLAGLFIMSVLPETKGQSLMKIDGLFGREK